MGSVVKLFLIFILLLFTACRDKQEQVKAEKQAKDPVEINVGLLDFDKWQELKQRHRGKVIIVNSWATWCLPCKEEFPDLVKLAEEYEDSDVVIIGVSVDYPDEMESKVIPFLQSQNATFPNYIQNFKKPEDLINMFNEEWRGAVPATFIFDKEGQQKEFLHGKKTFQEFKAAIEQIRNAG